MEQRSLRNTALEFLCAYQNISYANKVVSHALFTKWYLGHVSKKVEVLF